MSKTSAGPEMSPNTGSRDDVADDVTVSAISRIGEPLSEISLSQFFVKNVFEKLLNWRVKFSFS